LPTIVKKVGLIFFTGGYDFKRVISRLSKRLREERDRQLMEEIVIEKIMTNTFICVDFSFINSCRVRVCGDNL